MPPILLSYLFFPTTNLADGSLARMLSVSSDWFWDFFLNKIVRNLGGGGEFPAWLGRHPFPPL